MPRRSSVIPAPCLVVHGTADVRAALLPGLKAVLLSAPGAAMYGGAGWWRALVAAAPRPELVAADILDCADSPGRALEALETGCRILVLRAPEPLFGQVAASARSVGATLLTARPPALDLAQPGAARKLPEWLAIPPPPSG